MEVECLALKDLTSPRKSFIQKALGEEEEEEEECESEHKENVYVERRRSTPLKSTDAASALLLNRKGSGPDLSHVTPIKHGSLSEPWTPTANLKMLISAASPDIRDREMKKVLFRPIENEKEPPQSPELMVEEEADVDDSQFESLDGDEAEKKPSRKQKSLGLLCQKFLALYPDDPPPTSPIWISLDKVANSLGVERRRIYDIVNVLESLMIVGRMAKNSYSWYGRRRLETKLKELQSRGREQGYHLQMETGATGATGAAGATGARDCAANRDDEAEEGNGGGNRKDKSLRIMSQKFVMLFLVSKTQTVTLDAAAKILIEDSLDSSSHSKYKTKVRRLYDIANVLTSLGLIKKVHVREERGRKPAFKWLGPTEFNGAGTSPPAGLEASQRITSQDLNRIKMSRHASFNITPTSVVVQRQVNSAPNSPRREQHAAVQVQPVDYSRKTPVCRLQFGKTSETQTPASGPQPTLLMSSLSGQILTSSHPPPPPPPPHPHPNPPSSSSSSSSSSHSHCLAYLPSLSQPSVVMLYRTAEGQRSNGADGEDGRKRKREGEEEEEEEMSAAKKGVNGLKKSDEVRAESESSHSPVSEAQPAHYLYVPNNAGLNSLNFLLSSAHTASALSLPSGSVPTLAVPYLLLPPSTLPPYPLITSPIRTPPGSEAHPKLSFGVPAVMSPGQILVGTPSTPEQTRVYGASTPRSARGAALEAMTPQTPKENMTSASKSFFQTPASPANSLSAAPNGRKRGSAQRRLNVEHPPNI
ncbi:transcription factor E2F7 [Boleophthalmus pectinirostris]|uniref:transcription factor E2F7 n=1 Tax=Boleophthalmus pectinirostris TaxID=150288 RepID=UPI002430AE76|nr:transcription factor E2F7 [Boleophthalmus pectinirostris]